MNPLIKIHGGKYYIKDWVINNFPKNYESMIYVEPFIGGGSILLNKKPSIKEVVNDIDKELINIYQTLITDPKELVNQLKTYNYNEETFEEALIDKNHPFDDNIDAACNEYIIKRMSRGGLGETFAWSDRLRGNKPGDENAWDNSIENLKHISNRLSNVIILNQDFKNILSLYNSKDVFIYLDPPYLQKVRSTFNNYKHEMSENEHIKMLEMINKSKALILLSGYNSLLYNDYMRGWNKYEKIVKNNSDQSKIKSIRTEVLWCNY